MGDEPLRILDGVSRCRVTDPAIGTVFAPLVEISAQGAVVETGSPFDTDAYLDVTVELRGQMPKQFFGTVAGRDGKLLRIRWAHMDPGDGDKLSSLLDTYRSVKVEGEHRTRRLVRPSSSAITPFSETERHAKPTVPLGDANERKGTRRIVRATSPASIIPEADEAQPTAHLGEDSGSQPLVVSTESHHALPAIVRPLAPAPATSPAFASAPAPAAPVEPTGSLADLVGDGSPVEGSKPVVGQDGRMDIGASIRSRAKTIKASDLAARVDKVRVLNMATIKALIMDAVEEAAGHLTQALGEAERKRFLEEAEEQFKERLKAFELEKQSAQERQQALQDQLDSARRLLEDERKRSITADQFTVSSAGLEEIETRLRRLIDKSAADGKVNPALEEELRKVVAHVLDEERRRVREQELKAQNDKIELLEKKIGRLSKSLEDTERQRDEYQSWASALEQGGAMGLRQVISGGIKSGDPNKEMKIALMKELLEANRAFRKELGIELSQVEEVIAAAVQEEPKAEVPAVAPASEVPVSEAEAEDGPPPVPMAGAVDEDETFERPVKLVAVAGMKRLTADGEVEVAAGEEINPDDLPWDAPMPAGVAVGSAGIKRISVDLGKAPPPMDQRP